MPRSFEKDIAPLFTDGDARCMGGMGVMLREFAYMGDPAGDATYADHANARHVLGRLKGTEMPRMPPGGATWSDDRIALFEAWMVDWQP
ncbi:hypothetical protein SAMN02800694_3014 [Luteibacter sp. UNCMF331Sha3.1]|uniref:hypothetical protein n=1 Tax=Luteibacter sp. UNCMF331Sha3.1 TaxID=1502760 RepID=UPI00049249CE|nr:hypothetical protein [Luteibacter sp. UNCMF331Sha3.1]SEN18051.1 hypothetical protein SAMN02800694_3014 [Luteibacter sp. UNCMF331Sha3.1]